ncbi:AHH domain-containing protein, partial [Halorubrum tibetense]
HLRLERLKTFTQIQVQCRLDEYRRAASGATEGEWDDMQKAQKELANEKHHPTDRLANFMRSEGRPQPSPRFTAHHLVQGKGKTQLAAESRVDLHFHGIGINDPDNGVWMPMHKADKGHWAYKNAAAHSEIHTHNYEKWVHTHTQNLDSAQMMRDNLLILRTHLKNGTQP